MQLNFEMLQLMQVIERNLLAIGLTVTLIWSDRQADKQADMQTDRQTAKQSDSRQSGL